VTEVARPPRDTANAGGVIDAIRAGSIAADLGLLPGDRVVAIDGRPLRDAVDVQFYAAEDAIALDVLRGGASLRFEVAKHPDADLGIGFQDPAFDGIRICNNSCFFCFLKGNPKGMRQTLYVKDDDYRLSFYHGNFVTLTNLNDDDWKRLEEQRLSPINVSVHATDLELRRYMLGNKSAPDICDQLRRLRTMGIHANTQVVLCPGVNDGEALDRTIGDLSALYPAVQTISIVPVGATMTAEERISRGAHSNEVEGCNPDYARRIIDQVTPFQRRFRKEHGATLLYLADEYYLSASVEPPGGAHYDGYAQYENGIGMTRSLIEDWRRAKRGRGTRRLGTQGLARDAGTASLPRSPSIRRTSFVCGTLIAPTMRALGADFAASTGMSVAVHAVENTFFGSRVNVSGLLTSDDIERQLRGADLGDLAVLPRYALDYTGARFLDDRTPAELQAALGVPLAFASTLREVLQILDKPLHSDVTGASVGATTNGKSWVEFDTVGATERR
jgi:putative radical SAM enzyme (TIGR03279 family)